MKRTDKGTLLREYWAANSKDDVITLPKFVWDAQKETISALKQEVKKLEALLRIEKARVQAAIESTGKKKWQLTITQHWTSSEPDGSTFDESDSRYKYYVVPDDYTEQDVINYHLSGRADGKFPISEDLANYGGYSFEAEVWDWDKEEI